jgi:hypothetical protein
VTSELWAVRLPAGDVISESGAMMPQCYLSGDMQRVEPKPEALGRGRGRNPVRGIGHDCEVRRTAQLGRAVQAGVSRGVAEGEACPGWERRGMTGRSSLDACASRAIRVGPGPEAPRRSCVWPGA